jgi:hypothetical protein
MKEQAEKLYLPTYVVVKFIFSEKATKFLLHYKKVQGKRLAFAFYYIFTRAYLTLDESSTYAEKI